MNVFEKFFEVIVRLRGKDGCPWDREQTPFSLRENLLEETYECIEAINEDDPAHIKEELGDIFLLITMISYMYEQDSKFTVDSVLEGIRSKLIRRHPHVFGGADAKDANEAIDNWVRIKVEQEGRKPKDSILDEVKQSLPPLEKALKLQKKAAKSGFDWPELKGVTGKIEEELGEVKNEIDLAKKKNETGEKNPKLEEELGDLLFSVVNLCRYLEISPSVALQRSNSKFTERFKYVEKNMKDRNLALEQKNLKIMDELWEESKTKASSGF